VIFNPECAALLVHALVRQQTPGRDAGEPDVGPAWRVLDAPGDPDALFGGSFDDAGFSTRSLVLGDGQRRRGIIEGPGHYRRASFRDAPVALPAHLIVSRGADAPPARCLVATSLALHTLGPDRWLLQIEGGFLEAGSTGPPLATSHIPVSPTDLLRRCTAAIGPSRQSHLGVSTPSLLFDSLHPHS
jgi:hypothetical protein